MDSSQNNPYAAARVATCAAYSPALSGACDGAFCCVFATELAAPTRTALIKTAAALGYGEDAVTFIDATALEAHELFEVIEGLDPVCIVATNEPAIAHLTESYRSIITPEEPTRLFGRDLRAFSNLDALMQTPEGKQHAWGLLKSLPKV